MRRDWKRRFSAKQPRSDRLCPSRSRVSEPGRGFRAFVAAGRIEWTVEWLVLQPKWKALFTEWELRKAKARVDSVTAKHEPNQIVAWAQLKRTPPPTGHHPVTAA
jgi:hypothetical protein